MVFETLVDVGLALIAAVALAEWGKFRNKAEKGFNWLALGGVWLLFAGVTISGGSTFTVLGNVPLDQIGNIFGIIGWLFALIGTLFAAYEVLVEK